MNVGDEVLFAVGAVFLLAVGAVFDLHRAEVGSITIYTTPAVRDLLEKGVIPLWHASGGLRVEPVYVTAGEEYNRLRMSGSRPEADLFIHASPLFPAKGYDEGYFLPLAPEFEAQAPGEGFTGLNVDGNVSWYAFAWSPLVEVWSPRLGQAPDLATAELRYGLAHPTLSNNGVYTALFFEEVSPEAGQHARSRTVVQPVNARTNILGVADGSFDVTIGYEAVARFFEKQGAHIAYGPPVVNGENFTASVLVSVAHVREGPHSAEAKGFIDVLFTTAAQDAVERYNFRSVYNTTAASDGSEQGPAEVTFDWSDWEAIEKVLPRYEVISTYG